jgi:hypothetical protein
MGCRYEFVHRYVCIMISIHLRDDHFGFRTRLALTLDDGEKFKHFLCGQRPDGNA